jgi:hypothetical protein
MERLRTTLTVLCLELHSRLESLTGTPFPVVPSIDTNTKSLLHANTERDFDFLVVPLMDGFIQSAGHRTLTKRYSDEWLLLCVHEGRSDLAEAAAVATGEARFSRFEMIFACSGLGQVEFRRAAFLTVFL